MKQKYVMRTLYDKEYERLPRLKWSEAKRADVKKIAAVESERHALEAAALEARIMAGGYDDKRKMERDLADHRLDEVIRNPKRLRAETGQDTDSFFFMVAQVRDRLQGDVWAALMRNGFDEHKASWPGNRCSLSAAHQVFMCLYQMRTNLPQQAMESKFELDQGAISKQLWRIRYLLNQPESLPTADAMAEEIKESPLPEAIEICGGVLNIDCKHTWIEGPVDRESNDAAFSHKAYATTANALFICRADGRIIGWSGPLPGRRHDIVAISDHMPNLGPVTKSLENPDTPKDERITVNVDLGMQGIQDLWRGARIRIPYKRKPGQKKLPAWKRRRNRRRNSDRAIIEQDFRRLNSYAAIGGVYRGTIQDLGTTLNILTGIVNLQFILKNRDPKRSHRKGRKPGPKTPRSPGRKPRKTFE